MGSLVDLLECQSMNVRSNPSVDCLTENANLDCPLILVEAIVWGILKVR